MTPIMRAGILYASPFSGGLIIITRSYIFPMKLATLTYLLNLQYRLINFTTGLSTFNAICFVKSFQLLTHGFQTNPEFVMPKDLQIPIFAGISGDENVFHCRIHQCHWTAIVTREGLFGNTFFFFNELSYFHPNIMIYFASGSFLFQHIFRHQFPSEICYILSSRPLSYIMMIDTESYSANMSPFQLSLESI